MKTKLPTNTRLSAAPSELTHEEIITNFAHLPLQRRLEYLDRGVSKNMVAKAKDIFGLDYNKLSDLLLVTDRTLHLKKDEELFSKSVADKMYALIDLYSYAYKAFNNHQEVHRWMASRHNILKESPYKLMESFIGIQAVKDELRRMITGTF